MSESNSNFSSSNWDTDWETQENPEKYDERWAETDSESEGEEAPENAAEDKKSEEATQEQGSNFCDLGDSDDEKMEQDIDVRAAKYKENMEMLKSIPLRTPAALKIEPKNNETKE